VHSLKEGLPTQRVDPTGLPTYQPTMNIWDRPTVENTDGSVSTLESFSFKDKGLHILIPSISYDGKPLNKTDAINEYKRTGKHLGIFTTPEKATAYAQFLSQQHGNVLGWLRRKDPTYTLRDLYYTAQERQETVEETLYNLGYNPNVRY